MSSQDQTRLDGVVDSIVYNKDSFNIIRFTSRWPSKSTLKAKGNFYGLDYLSPNTPISLLGKWSESSKYGREFLVKSWGLYADTPEDIVGFLTSSLKAFSDIALVKKLVATYGLNTFDELSGDNPLESFEEISQESKSTLTAAWVYALNARDLTARLTSKEIGFTAIDVQNILSRFGWHASKILAANPYRLLSIPNFPFAKADRYATASGIFSKSDPRRLQGAILWSLLEASRQGHLFLRKSEVQGYIQALQVREGVDFIYLGDPIQECLKAIDSLIDQKAVIFEQESGMYLANNYEVERESSKILARLTRFENPSKGDVDSFIASYEKSHKFSLSEAQKQALHLVNNYNVVTITGLPGTGKTTVLKAIVQFLEEQKLTVNLMAPTGVASKRLASVAGRPAFTVHKSLRYDGVVWGFNENNRFITDVVVLDETSMVDQELLYRLLVSLRPSTRLVLVGDDAQLPSVGPGNVLRELLGCPSIPKVRLTEIFRQSLSGEIVTSSHKIHSGNLPDLDKNHVESEFRFVRISDEEKIVNLIVEMATRLKAKHSNFQILSPKYEGVVGVNNLNNRLREALNPPGPMEEIYGGQTFRQGDRLLVVKNDYKLGIYNGDVGKLVDIYKDKALVKIHGVGNGLDTEVMFDATSVALNLKLAYAMTVHRCQGSEYDTVIIPMVKSQGNMLQRNLLYTAITRAKKRVWILGEETAIQLAVKNNKVINRNTILSKAIDNFVEVGVPQEEDL